MGFWITRYFIPQRDFKTNAQTEIFPLPKVGMISNIMLEIYGISGSTNTDLYVPDIISKVEVIGNGSTVIQSLDGRQIQASNAFDDLVMPPDKEYSPSGGCWGFMDIRFGRFPGDEKYALDCTKWDSLELRITYAVAAGGTAGADGFTDDKCNMTAWGLYAPDGGGMSPVGFIKKEEKKTYTSSIGGTEDLKLPSDFPYRRLMLFTETHGVLPGQGFQYTTININEGAKKPLDRLHGYDFEKWQSSLLKHGTFKHYKRYNLTTANQDIHPPLRYIRGVVETRGSCGYMAISPLDPNLIRIATEVNGWGHLDVEGLCPWGALVIDLEKQSGGKDGVEAMEACWAATEKDAINLEIVENYTDAALSIVLEQYATQPIGV